MTQVKISHFFFKNDVDILKEFIQFSQEKISDSKYCMSFLNSTDTTTKKVLEALLGTYKKVEQSFEYCYIVKFWLYI